MQYTKGAENSDTYIPNVAKSTYEASIFKFVLRTSGALKGKQIQYNYYWVSIKVKQLILPFCNPCLDSQARAHPFHLTEGTNSSKIYFII